MGEVGTYTERINRKAMNCTDCVTESSLWINAEKFGCQGGSHTFYIRQFVGPEFRDNIKFGALESILISVQTAHVEIHLCAVGFYLSPHYSNISIPLSSSSFTHFIIILSLGF